ncbi:MAG TPA: hypothetical protein VMV57_13035 [Terracidiphilus sp.]|nr:hypothetical protein [Terracidiphilus sp.]
MNQSQESPVVPNPPREAETTSSPDHKGAESLRLAADLILQQKCIEIAEALATSSILGHIQSARFLYVLAEGQQKQAAAEVVEELQSLAIELSQETEWQEPLKGETA